MRDGLLRHDDPPEGGDALGERGEVVADGALGAVLLAELLDLADQGRGRLDQVVDDVGVLGVLGLRHHRQKVALRVERLGYQRCLWD